VNNRAGRGGDGGTGPLGGDGGTGGNGGAIWIGDGISLLWNATIANDLVGLGGKGAGGGSPGAKGVGGGLFVQSSTAAENMRLKNTIVASTSNGANCSGSFTDRHNNLSFGDHTCPGGSGNPLLGQLQNNGGPTETMALRKSSAAIDRVPNTRCPALDQRGRSRPDRHERSCDIGAYEHHD
jgi:hypothetical protein